MRRTSTLLLWALGLVPLVRAQVPVQAPSGTLRGTVQDSATGRPVGYALIVILGKDRELFATESGRFALPGLSSGALRIRVQQIGFRAQTISLVVDTRASAPPVSPLVIRLVPQAFRLPELAVHGTQCQGLRDLSEMAVDGGNILEEAYTNAERIRVLERRYPFILLYQRYTTLLDSTYSRMSGEVDTLRKDSRNFQPYAPGKLVYRPGSRLERVEAFHPSDIASDEFQQNHCFSYGGRDSSLEDFPSYRVDFVPAEGLRSIDWAGTLLIDSASRVLLKTEAHVVNLPASGTRISSASCTFFYQPIVPSLPQEFQVQCVSNVRGSPPYTQIDRYLLVNRRFLGKHPIDPGDPP